MKSILALMTFATLWLLFMVIVYPATSIMGLICERTALVVLLVVTIWLYTI